MINCGDKLNTASFPLLTISEDILGHPFPKDIPGLLKPSTKNICAFLILLKKFWAFLILLKKFWVFLILLKKFLAFLINLKKFLAFLILLKKFWVFLILLNQILTT